MVGIGFRRAAPGDATALGALHVASWRETYAGLLPDAMLRDLSVEARSDMWRAILDGSRPGGRASVFLAETADTIVGFGACGAQRDAGLRARGYDGEIAALYVLQSHQRAGIGGTLMRLMAGNLGHQGAAAAALWVLRDNASARAFYERLRGVVVGERAEEQSGVIPAQVAYGWRDLSQLLSSPRT